VQPCSVQRVLTNACLCDSYTHEHLKLLLILTLLLKLLHILTILQSEYVRALQWEHTHKGAAAASSNENDEGEADADPETNGRKLSVGGASPVKTAAGGSNWLGTDPVLGQRVCSEQLRRCSSEEVDEQIKAYNQSEQDEKADSGTSGGANGSSSSGAGAGGTEGPGSPPASRPKAKQAYG
jgi:hypothetical protein